MDINKEKFLKLELKDISQVYSGKRNNCRCGCGGKYTASSFMVNPQSEINDNLIVKRLKRAKNLVQSGADVMYGGTFIDVETGVNKTLTFYIDEVK